MHVRRQGRKLPVFNCELDVIRQSTGFKEKMTVTLYIKLICNELLFVLSAMKDHLHSSYNKAATHSLQVTRESLPQIHIHVEQN